MTSACAQDLPRGSTVSGGTAMYAMVRTQGRTIAIPGGFVTQAVEAPPELTQVPRRVDAIEGLLTLGHRVVPVLSLRRWLTPVEGVDRSSGAAQPARGLVLLLEQGEVSIGLAIDAVVGTQRIRPDQVRRLFHDDSPDELFQCVALFGCDSVPTAILEPGRLIALAGVWVADAAVTTARTPDAEEALQDAPRTSRAETYATFGTSDVSFALPAVDIGELLRRPPLRKELLRHDGVLGLCDWRGRVVPVVDLAGALHALPSDDEPAWLCVLCRGDLAIGIVMHDVLEIARIAPGAGTPEHAPAAERSVVARRVVVGKRLLQVIDVEALLRRYTETAISAKGAQPASLRSTSDPAAPAYMVFDAGGMFAASIDGVQEVIALPDELRPRLEAGIPSTLQWRDQVLPIMPIADSLITLPMQSACQLVIVRQEERLAALTIRGVKGMVPRGSAVRNRIRLKGRPVEIISIQTEDQRATYPVVDLRAAFRPAV